MSLRLAHFTPLRYPGGKAKLAKFIKAIIEANDLCDGDYVEPYAGGAGVALELLMHEYVQHIHINDISRPIFSFWRSVLENTDEFVRLIRNTPLTIRSWKRQKRILMNQDDYDDLELGFATFFLNRTNRSGILNGGVIGGRDQTGLWKIDARFNRAGLIARVEAIARMRRRISLSRHDATDFLKGALNDLPRKTLIYLDPPYYCKGKQLYYDYYSHDDHAEIAALVKKSLTNKYWIVSYDDTPQIRELYTPLTHMAYEVGYSARDVRRGSEIMFFAPGLRIPAMTGSMREVVGASSPLALSSTALLPPSIEQVLPGSRPIARATTRKPTTNRESRCES
jgi:DNA adenine methylase